MQIRYILPSKNIIHYKYEVCWEKWHLMNDKCWGRLEKINYTYHKMQDMGNLIFLFIAIFPVMYECKHTLAQSFPMSQHTVGVPQI